MSHIQRPVALAALLALAAAAVPAPIPKDKPHDPGPVTAEQLHASKRNLQRLALALMEYAEDHGDQLPTNVPGKDGKPILSWRVQVLRYLGEADLLKQFKFDEPWDGDHNRKLIDRMPATFAPVRVKADGGMTYYQALAGPRGWLRPGKPAKFPDSFPDGCSNTFFVAEAARPVVWTKPEDLEYDGKTVPKFGGLFDGRFQAVMADGSVLRVRADAPAEALGLLIDPADGQTVDLTDVRDRK